MLLPACLPVHQVLGAEMCPELSELNLLGNPVCDKINYEANVIKRVGSQLAMLDGRSVTSSAPEIMSLDGTEVVVTAVDSSSSGRAGGGGGKLLPACVRA